MNKVVDFQGDEIIPGIEVIMPGVIGGSNRQLLLRRGIVLDLREVQHPEWDGNVKILPTKGVSARWYNSNTLIKAKTPVAQDMH